MQPISDYRVIGSLSPAACAVKLRELGDESLARDFESIAAEDLGGRSLGFFGKWMTRKEPAWKHINHHFGFITPDHTKQPHLNIVHAGGVNADKSLINVPLIVTLNRLFVAEYPGRGEHRILFDFAAENCFSDTSAEQLRFSMGLRAKNGEMAPVIGWPIFTGLVAGPQGVALECATVNVKNPEDEKIVSVFETDIFRKGLELLSVAQPAIAPLASLSSGLVRALSERSKNVPVQKFSIGLDFSNNQLGARLAEGNYIVVQAPIGDWDWATVAYEKSKGQVVHRNSGAPVKNYNYIVFGVNRAPRTGAKK